jgi:hypothetical protein
LTSLPEWTKDPGHRLFVAKRNKLEEGVVYSLETFRVSQIQWS